jgi:hypothetical protein
MGRQRPEVLSERARERFVRAVPRVQREVEQAGVAVEDPAGGALQAQAAHLLHDRLAGLSQKDAVEVMEREACLASQERRAQRPVEVCFEERLSAPDALSVVGFSGGATGHDAALV